MAFGALLAKRPKSLAEAGDLGANPPQGWLFTASARHSMQASSALALTAALGQTCIMAKAIGWDYGIKNDYGKIAETDMITDDQIKEAIRRQDSLGRCL